VFNVKKHYLHWKTKTLRHLKKKKKSLFFSPPGGKKKKEKKIK